MRIALTTESSGTFILTTRLKRFISVSVCEPLLNSLPEGRLFVVGNPAEPSGLFGGYPYCYTVWRGDVFPDGPREPGDWLVSSIRGTARVADGPYQVRAGSKYQPVHRSLVRRKRCKAHSAPTPSHRSARHEVWQPYQRHECLYPSSW
jgi:hypothetical protein